jgi:hypothetical protein
MKPVFGIFLLSTLLVACKKETKSSRTEEIVGAWTLKAEGPDADGDGQLQNNEVDTPAAGSQIFEVYRADGTGDYIVRLRGQQQDNKSVFTWFFADGEKELRTVRGRDTGSRTIIKLEGGRMERYDPLQNPRFLEILEK